MFICSESQELSKENKKSFFGFTVFEIWRKVPISIDKIRVLIKNKAFILVYKKELFTYNNHEVLFGSEVSYNGLNIIY